ncbi:carbon-nitrogen hydrolase family protein [Desulfotruncus alcoholivorax]|uniref:carbon-nitrogen hydrolase family protein n=1 Tax=Desulfotruncus alcoholivorax TaxID=265477 RepID=UPI00041AC450|nr:carbon-nitrogen hydrolase family protein [Desulfotruncus alcoholivorax]
MNYNLCIVQFDRSNRKPDINAQKMIQILKEVKEADFILLPEDWLGPLVVDEDYHMSVIGLMQNSLPSENILLISGAQYVRQSEVIISTGAFVTKKRIAFYDKIFPSHAIGERHFVTPGTRQPVFEYRGIKVSAVVCVDLFYPEIVRKLALKGAQIIFNPANIPAGRMDLWQHIGITRAAENTVFLAMANNTRTSYPDGREVTGRSFVAGPDGLFFNDTDTEPGILRATLDISLIDQVRSRWKYLDDVSKKCPQLMKGDSDN